MKSNFKTAFLFIMLLAMAIACNKNKNQEKINGDKNQLTQIFPKGEKGSKDLLTGNAYNTGLFGADSVFTTAGGNV